MAFRFLQWLSTFFNGFPIFLDGFLLSKKFEKIYLRRQVYKRSLFELCISRHLLPKLRNSRYSVYISPTLMRSACFCFSGSAVSGLLLWEIFPRLSQYKMVVGIGGTIPTEAARKINKDITAPRSSSR
jgi:hypothetical protein